MKKFKCKKSKNKLFIIIFILFIILFILLSNLKLKNSYHNFINYIYKDIGIIKKEKINILSILTKNVDYLINDYSFYYHDNIIVKENGPIIYLYNTHDSEKYKDNTSILDVSNMIKNKLNNYNINSITENRSISKYLDNYQDSYKISRKYMEECYLKNNSLEYFIDIHRDSVNSLVTEFKYNNKDYAKIMFVLGTDNKNYQNNEILMNKINDYVNKLVPGLSRGIYKKDKSIGNGIYNQDFSSNTILIEIGGVDSNIESINNSTDILVSALYYIIGDKNEIKKNY